MRLNRGELVVASGQGIVPVAIEGIPIGPTRG